MSLSNINNVQYTIQQEEIIKLSNQISDIKFLFEFPKLYMSKYFDDLRYKVDLYAAKHMKSFKNKTEDIYLKMIDKIDSYEQECFKVQTFFVSNFIRSTAKSLEAIENKLFSLEKRLFHDVYDLLYYTKEIEELLYETRIQIERIIFKNKTLFFFDETCDNQISSVGGNKTSPAVSAKLIFILNEYFGRRGLNFLISNQFHENTDSTSKLTEYVTEFKLTSEMVKAFHLKETLNSSSLSPIEEIRLEYNEIDFSNKNITKIDSEAFRNLTDLKSINLSSNYVENFQYDLLIGLNELEAVDLSCNLLLRTIDTNLLSSCKNLKKLNLNSNELKSIDEYFLFGLNKLNTLNLAHNKLSFLNAQHLRGLVSLEIIDLSFNYLTVIGSGQFQDLNSLQIIFLNNNQITEFNENVFQGLSSLTKLNLSNNRTTHFGSYLFRSLNNLTNLDLSFNRIDHLDKNLFHDLTSLTSIDLSANLLSNLVGSLFKNLKNLNYISLSKNHFKSLPRDLFDGLDNLKKINLSFNKLESLDGYLFKNLIKLADLDLSHNKIKYLDVHIFHGLKGLNVIDLSYNKLSTFDGSLFKDLYSLLNVILENNAF